MFEIIGGIIVIGIGIGIAIYCIKKARKPNRGSGI